MSGPAQEGPAPEPGVQMMRDQLSVLRRAAALLASAGDFDQVMEHTIAACLPALGDFGFFDLHVGDGSTRRTARAHENPALEAMLRPTQWVRSERTDINLCALSSGEAGLHPAIDDAWYLDVAVNDGHLALLRQLAFRSMLTVPMRYQGELVGALTLFHAWSGRAHTAEDLAFAEDLAALAAPVVANARLLRLRERAEVALRRSEEWLRLAVEAGGLGIWDWDIVNDRVSWSDGVYALHGVDRDAFGGRVSDFAALIHPDDRAVVQLAIETALRDQPRYEVEFRIEHPTRGIRSLATRADIMRDDDGRAIRMVGATWDVTARVELLAAERTAHAEAERARQQAESANRAKDEFLAMLGHELRNPLAPITAALYLMQRTHPEIHERERGVISRQVAHLSRLVDDLLDVSRIVRGKVQLDRKRVDLAEIIRGQLEIARPLFDARSITVQKSLIDGAWVDGDADRLAQVISNLLTNAAKFTNEGGRVTVAITRHDDQLEATVHDTGAGISPALLPHVFGLFVQGAQPLDRGDGGLGLGLAIVKNLVELHGGTVVAESAGDGQGATFRIRLPRVDERRSAPRVAVEVPTTTVFARLLVVDDNLDAADLLGEILRASGYEVRIAPSGDRAVAMLSDFAPDAAILDIGLPGMDGYELARRIRGDARHQRMRLVALTGYGRDVDREQARAAGFDEHVVKPVMPKDLLQMLSRLLT
ncbi:MAG TPA: ATP-binding protein [Kofleriaceae bacterium]|nr:ATP-binding protein [Kofleriaceae bacterium]